MAGPGAEPADGAVYRWRDAGGVIHYSAALSEVPEAQRAGAERLTVAPAPGGAIDAARPAGELIEALEDASGVELDEARAEAARLGKKAKATARDLGGHAIHQVERGLGKWIPGADHLDPTSFGVGFGLALGLGLLLGVVRSNVKRLVKVALVVAILSMLGGGYLGAVRSAAGLGAGGAVSPQTNVNDAKKAASRANRRYRDQERVLRQIEEGSK
jgi:hypothetical protein